jgi:Protein of unknown function (DUF3631)
MGEIQRSIDPALVLDEVRDFIAAHVVATESQLTAMTLFAAATNVIKAAKFPTFPRMLFTADQEESGKTTAMEVTALLSANPVSAKGTYAALKSAIAESSEQPENPVRTFYFDQVDNVFGNSGMNRGGNATLHLLLQEGYKSGAKDAWSVNRTQHQFSLFFPVLMSGTGTSVPRDIRGRCVVIKLSPGKPDSYFDERVSKPQAVRNAKALGDLVKSYVDELKDFRALGLHPKLTNRKLEVWEPLFAVAKVIGGQRWLNKCLAAFLELSVDSSDQVTLTGRQQLIKDCAGVLTKVAFELPNGRFFAEGNAIASELRHLGDPAYTNFVGTGLNKHISDNLPCEKKQVRVGRDRFYGYYADDVTDAWQAIKPEEPQDVEMPEEVNPFDVIGDDFDEVFEIAA